MKLPFKLTDIIILAGVGVGAFVAYKLFTGELELPFANTNNTDIVDIDGDSGVGVVGEGGTSDRDAYNGRITLSS